MRRSPLARFGRSHDRSARRTGGNRRPLLAGVAGFGAVLALRRALRPRFDLRGRVALVTGGSRGLGLLVARELALRGARVAICARDRDELERARAILRREGLDVLPVVADVADPASVRRLFARIRDRWDPPEILVNNAGIIEVGPFSTMVAEDFRRVMDVNYGGMLNTVLEAVPAMRERGEGRIANVTSIGARLSVPHLLPYGVAKFAAAGLSEGLHAELRRDGIVVTTVVPGLMRTGSPVQAAFRGEPDAEYSWFSVASSSPLMSMRAERAARRIVRAIERGEAAVTLSWQARLAEIAHGLAPGLVGETLAAVERFLPRPADGLGQAPVRGGVLEVTPAVAGLTGRMRRAAMRNNELAEVPRPIARAPGPV